MKKILCLLLVLLSVMLSSCSQIEDTNGPDDYSIVTFTDEDILKGAINTITIGVFESSSFINGELKGTYKVSKLSGMVEIEKISSDRSNINFDIDFTCESGNAMLVIVSKGRIVKKIEANEKVNFDITNSNDYYNLLLVGESAKASVKYKVVC